MDYIITDEKILHQISKPTTWEEIKKLKLKERLQEAIKGAWIEGVGLAAIQIGIPLQYAWYKFKDPVHNGVYIEGELLNPVIKSKTDLTICREGCLSIPNHWAKTERYQRIELNNDGGPVFVTSVFEAWVIQHEIDHMNGILVTDIEKDKYHTLGRNDPCGCGSGKKYKKCCLR